MCKTQKQMAMETVKAEQAISCLCCGVKKKKKDEGGGGAGGDDDE